MELTQPFLANIWLVIIGFLLLLYVVTDGYGLGVGMLSLGSRDEEEIGLMIASVESVWHANQTWLVVLGGVLFGSFPLFYGVVFTSLYIPIALMLFGLMFRGITFEFRHQSKDKSKWSLTFGVSSFAAALAQGLGLGGLLGGLPLEGGRFVGEVWGWFDLYAVLTAFGVVSGYLLLGSTYLIARTTDHLQQRSYRWALFSLISTVSIAVAVYLWTAIKHPHIAKKWLVYPESVFATLFPMLTLLAFGMVWASLLRRREFAPLMWSIAGIVLAFVTVSVGFYPFMIPPPVTVSMAAASLRTLKIMILVMSILIPAMLVYNIYQYRVFLGKVRRGGYGK